MNLSIELLMIVMTFVLLYFLWVLVGFTNLSPLGERIMPVIFIAFPAIECAYTDEWK